LAYALGIGSAYIFSIGLWVYAAVAMSGAILLVFSVSPARGSGVGGGEAERKGLAPKHTYGIVSRRVAAFMLLAFAAGGIYCGSALDRVDPLAQYAVSMYNHPEYDRETVLEDVAQTGAASEMPPQIGRVMKITVVEEDYSKLTVRTGGRNVLVRVTGKGLVPADLIGRRISFSGSVEMPTTRRNPGCFDYRLYLMSQDIRVIVKCDIAGIALCEGGGKDYIGGIYNTLGGLKYAFLGRAKMSMNPEAYALFSGMLFGDNSAMEDDFYEMFQKNGVAHILSVSGIHVAIVYGFFNALFGRRRSIPVCLAIIVFLFIYALLSEFSPSVVRAVVMISVHIFAKLTAKRYDLLTGICAAAFAILLYNPLQLFGVGFQLSFLAVLLLAFAIPFTDRFIGFRDARTGKKLSKPELAARGKETLPVTIRTKIVGAFVPLLIIQIGMSPMITYSFNYVSVSGMLLNIPVVTISGLIIPLGILMIPIAVLAVSSVPALSAFAPSLFTVFARVAEIMLDAVIRLTEIANASRFSYFQVTSPRVQWVFLFYGILFFCLSETCGILLSRRCLKPALRFAAGLILAVMFTLTSSVCVWDESALTFVDVGQGDCLHIRTPDGRNYLVDGGGQIDYDVGKNVLLPYLLKNGVKRIDGVFVTHLHTDHYKGLRELSENMPITNLFLYDGNRVRVAETIQDSAFEAEDLVFLSSGDRVDMGGNVSMTTLYPPKATQEEYERMTGENEDENKNSLLMRIDYEGISILMTGDMGEDGEQAIMRSLGDERAALKSTILKVGHHGSKTSTSDPFLQEVAPQIAVIQVGRNTYGHPTTEVLEKLYERDIMTYRNDLDGAVIFDIKKGDIVEISSTSRIQTD
jgi:competence protein ComEC